MRPRFAAVQSVGESGASRAGGRGADPPRVARLARCARPLVHAAAALAAAGLVASCSSQTPLMALLFDIPPPGKEPPSEPDPRPARRSMQAARPGPQISKEYLAILDAVAKAGPPPNWPEIFEKLPKDDEDNIDWMAALRDKVISPRPGIEDGAQETKVLDQDVKLATSGKPDRMVVFSHKVHGQWLSCGNCHPAIFAEKTGTAKITMDDIDEGKYCGVCHDKVAMALPSGCKGCHKVAPAKKKK